LISLSRVFLFPCFIKHVAFFNSENVPRQRKRKKGRGWEKNMRRRCQREKKRDASSKTLAVCEWRWMASTIKIRSLEKCRSANCKRVILAPRVRKYVLSSKMTYRYGIATDCQRRIRQYPATYVHRHNSLDIRTRKIIVYVMIVNKDVRSENHNKFLREKIKFCTIIIHGKNNFAERSKILLDINWIQIRKVILLNYQNNYEHSNYTFCICVKNFPCYNFCVEFLTYPNVNLI